MTDRKAKKTFYLVVIAMSQEAKLSLG